MAPRSAIRHLTDILLFDIFEADWQARWLAERGIEIISEASRHLPDELKTHHPEIPWKKVAGIGNILRHDYGNIAAPVIWALIQDHLPQLEQVCRHEISIPAEGR